MVYQHVRSLMGSAIFALLYLMSQVNVNKTIEGYDKDYYSFSYGFSDVVQCLDSMLEHNSFGAHFVFVGDSRIRHLFYSFIQVR